MAKKKPNPSNLVIREPEIVAEARRISAELNLSLTFVINTALQHGLPIAYEKLKSLKPAAFSREQL